MPDSESNLAKKTVPQRGHFRRCVLFSLCPRCGKGALYTGWLQPASRCASCSLSFDWIDAGDGAIIFVMLFVGAIVVPLGFFLYFHWFLPAWIVLSTMLAASIVLCVWLLRPAKSFLIVMQYMKSSKEVSTK